MNNKRSTSEIPKEHQRETKESKGMPKETHTVKQQENQRRAKGKQWKTQGRPKTSMRENRVKSKAKQQENQRNAKGNQKEYQRETKENQREPKGKHTVNQQESQRRAEGKQ